MKKATPPPTAPALRRAPQRVGVPAPAPPATLPLPVPVCTTDARLQRPVPNPLWQSRFNPSGPSRSIWSGFNPKSAAAGRRAAAAGLQHGRPFQVEAATTTPGGTRWYRIEFAPRQNARGQVSGWWLMAHDITTVRTEMDSLRARENRLREVIESVDGVFWLMSVDQSQNLLVTGGYEALFGREMARLRHQPTDWMKAIHPDDLPRVQSHFAKIGAGPPDRLRVEYRLRSPLPDGSPRWVETHFSSISGTAGQPRYLGAFSVETSVRHRLQAALDASEARFQEWAEVSDAVFFSTSPDFSRLIDVSEPPNPRTRPSLKPEKDPPQGWFQRILPEDRRKLKAAMAQLKTGAASQIAVECRHRRTSDGGIRTALYTAHRRVDPNGKVRKIIWIVTDLTDRKAMEAELRMSEERFQLAARGSTDGLFDWDIAHNQIFYSPRWKELLGYQDHEISPNFTEWRERFHPGDRIRALQYLGEFLAGPEPMFQLEARAQHKDGSYRWLLSRGMAIRNQEGRAVRLIGSTTDLTAQKELQRKMMEASEHERRMIGFDLHDGLGQELTAVEMLCQSMRSQISPEDSTVLKLFSEMSKLIQSSISHVRTLSRGLSPTTLAAHGLIDALEELAQVSTNASGISCRFVGGDSELRIERLVSTHLYRIAQEAVNNALKHSGATQIEINLRHLAGKLRLIIEDNGRGLPPPGKAAQHGHGLEVMQYRAKLIGAHLDLDAGPLGGTRITCLLEIGPAGR